LLFRKKKQKKGKKKPNESCSLLLTLAELGLVGERKAKWDEPSWIEMK
jgi:hypothetical protein